MRTLCLSLLGTALTIMALPTHAHAQDYGQIAFVDMEQIFEDYYETKRFDKRLKEQTEDAKADSDEMIADLKDLEEEFNALKDEVLDVSLSEDARKRKNAEAEDKLLALREMQMDIRKFQEERRSELEAQGRRMRERIVKKIDRVIQDYAQEHSLFAIIDASGNSFNQVPIILYSDSRADVTDAIIAILNEGHEEEAAAEEADEEDDDASFMDPPADLGDEPPPGEAGE